MQVIAGEDILRKTFVAGGDFLEIRVLNYFLTVAREASVTRAASALHLSQPALSRQMKELEEELGKQLFLRVPRGVLLTEEGMVLRRRAEEILALVEKTEQELRRSTEEISGDVYIGAGETKCGHVLTRTMARVQAKYPDIRFHISSGDTIDVTEQLDKGLIDFGLIFDPIDHTRYQVFPVAKKDIWGVLMRRDSLLAEKETITAEDLEKKPLILSRHARDGDVLTAWLKKPLSAMNIAATYSLAYNASLMVEDGVGYALVLDGLIASGEDSPLVFRPLAPALTAGMNIVTKKNPVLSKAAACYLETLKQELGNL